MHKADDTPQSEDGATVGNQTNLYLEYPNRLFLTLGKKIWNNAKGRNNCSLNHNVKQQLDASSQWVR